MSTSERKREKRKTFLVRKKIVKTFFHPRFIIFHTDLIPRESQLILSNGSDDLPIELDESNLDSNELINLVCYFKWEIFPGRRQKLNDKRKFPDDSSSGFLQISETGVSRGALSEVHSNKYRWIPLTKVNRTVENIKKRVRGTVDSFFSDRKKEGKRRVTADDMS